MKVRILTPIDERSAIATKTLAIAEQLSRYIEVDIIGEPTELPRVTSYPIHMWPPPQPLDEPDVWIVALGNSQFHKVALQVVQQKPTIVMLHDLSMFGAASVEVGSAAVNGPFGNLIEEEYGAQARLDAAALEGQRAFAYIREQNFLRRYLRKSVGVVTHSEFAVDMVRAATVAPVRLARLPLTDSVSTAHRTSPVMMSLGHVNANRSTPLILEALSLLPTAVRPQYRIVGPVAPEERLKLQNLSIRLGIHQSVVLTGRVGEDELRQELATASMFINLRNPVLEAASDSLLRQMAQGAPVLVYNHGCYAEVPDNAVVKLQLDTTPAELAREIEQLFVHPDRRDAIGRSAQRYVADAHRLDAYAQVLLGLINDAMLGRPRSDMLNRVGQSMSSIGIVANDPVVRNVARAEHFLFGDQSTT